MYLMILVVIYISVFIFFFFSSRRRHTRYWRDWSSDVCSSDLSIEFSYINQLGRNEEMKSAIQIPDKQDSFDDIRLEFREMLKSQIAKGNNGLKKAKYITFTVEADNLEQATSKLERLEIDILSSLKSMGVRAESLTDRKSV